MNQLLSNLEFGDPSRLRTVEPHWFDLYRDLHAHPELSGNETRTAALVAEELRRIGGWDVTIGVGGTGVVGVLQGSSGPVILLRADMDALPVAEDTGLSYASKTDGVMHACGHDVHVTALLATCAALSADPTSITGTVVAVFQPAEETGSGARAMVDDGIFDRFPRPDLCLGQHVGPTPAGMLVSKPDILMAASDTIQVVFHGRGGHASSPYACIDPLLMAASFALRLQSLVAHEAATPTAPVLTVGALHAGTAANIIADDAELLLSLRTFSASSREHMLESVGRIARAEADGAGATEAPDVHAYNGFPATVNTPDATSTVMTTYAGPDWECTPCRNHFQAARTSESSALLPNAPPYSGISAGRRFGVSTKELSPHSPRDGFLPAHPRIIHRASRRIRPRHYPKVSRL
nr:amidohydrolase [Rhodococcus erythropolis]